MITRGAAFPAALAIDCYRRQTYRERELVIVCDRPNSELASFTAALADPSIRYLQTAPATLGELRNVSVAHACGVLLCQWDDDDLYHPSRLELQVAALEHHGDAATFLLRWTVWWPARMELAVSGRRAWEGTMLARRDALPIYPAQARNEDNVTVSRLCQVGSALLLDQPRAYCYVVNGRNSYPDSHFEHMLSWASHRSVGTYDADLATLATCFPILEYTKGLAEREAELR